ncbi:MAG: hypothetical protein AB9866_18755 [Syntrophobacteraceae bacterium]
MNQISLLEPSRRSYGKTCRNCVHLSCEYELETKLGAWVCDKFPHIGDESAFPYKCEVSCFEPCFWYTIFAPQYNASDDVIEGAFNMFREGLEMARGNIPAEAVLDPG